MVYPLSATAEESLIERERGEYRCVIFSRICGQMRVSIQSTEA